MSEQEKTEMQINKTCKIHTKWKRKNCCLPGGIAFTSFNFPVRMGARISRDGNIIITRCNGSPADRRYSRCYSLQKTDWKKT